MKQNIILFFLNFILNNLIIVIFFLFLFIALFLGDGKQSLTDIFGISFVITIGVLFHYYGEKRREIPNKQYRAWLVFLGYCLFRTVFSDDTGYSCNVYIRYAEAFI